MLLGLKGLPREVYGSGARLANGSGARAALWDREGLPTTSSVGPHDQPTHISVFISACCDPHKQSFSKSLLSSTFFLFSQAKVFPTIVTPSWEDVFSLGFLAQCLLSTFPHT